MTLEACVQNLNEALIAQSQGAHQIELCDRLDLDGTSPSISTIQSVVENLRISIKVIVNPNPYNYIYTLADFKKIEHYIDSLNKLHIHGIVFGPLNKEGLPDLALIKAINEMTDLPITFHKAIDASRDILLSTKLLAEQGIVKFILSSGGQNTAREGINQLLQMQSMLVPTDINLIAAGKITSSNLLALHKKLNLSYYHGKKIVGDLT
jgi:copper homeostasis protein